jgi:hypothetical protein
MVMAPVLDDFYPTVVPMVAVLPVSITHAPIMITAVLSEIYAPVIS